jgi:hypothetical protein
VAVIDRLPFQIPTSRRLSIQRGAWIYYYQGVPILQVIARLSFRAARPQPWGAHEYTVRSPENEADHVALWNAIEADGTFERWRGRRKRYLHPGDGWKDWHMGRSTRAGCSTGCGSKMICRG